MVLAIQNAPPVTGWRLRMQYNEAIDEEINPQRGDCTELLSRTDALLGSRRCRMIPRQLRRSDHATTQMNRTDDEPRTEADVMATAFSTMRSTA